jgi:hypothetical protein
LDAKGLAQHSYHTLGEFVSRVALQESTLIILPHAFPKRLIVEQLQEFCCYVNRILLTDVYRTILAQNVRDRGMTGCEHWKTRCHRLDDRNRLTLERIPGRKGEDVAFLEDSDLFVAGPGS